MSSYVKSTNFAIKDSLVTTDPAKVIKGTEIDNEYNAIANAISSKADTNSPALTGTPTAPTATLGSNTTQLATTAFVTAALSLLYPVGSIYINASSATNPSTLLGFGTWEAFGAGKVMVGLDSADTLFDTLEETGGSKDSVVVAHTHTTTVTDPGHNHSVTIPVSFKYDVQGNDLDVPAYQNTSYTTSTSTTGISVVANSTGVSATNTNVQPFVVVKMWKRTA